MFSQGFYGSIGYRISKPNEPIDLWDVYQGFDWTSLDYFTEVTPNNSYIVGSGYRWLTKRKPFNNADIFGNVFATMSLKGFDYEGYSNDNFNSGGTNWVVWSIGTGCGTKLKNGITISADLEYNFTAIDDQVSFNQIPSANFLTLNINLGYMKKGQDLFSHFGLFGSKITRDHFLNQNGSTLNSTQLTLESGYLGAFTLLAMVLVPIYGAGGNDVHSSPSSSRGCNVYGKIRFVDIGEDYKVKFVIAGEDVRIKYVLAGANSPGEWDIVDIGEDYKIRVVGFGEDFKVKEVIAGQGCN